MDGCGRCPARKPRHGLRRGAGNVEARSRKRQRGRWVSQRKCKPGCVRRPVAAARKYLEIRAAESK
ncbi:hypothetical protein LC55x_2886 [Lysobacter capsici]|nr:hypothetical protein LC55x_2886 [Lysobacter capsici]